MTEKMDMLRGEKSNAWVNQCVHATCQFLLFDFCGLIVLKPVQSDTRKGFMQLASLLGSCQHRQQLNA